MLLLVVTCQTNLQDDWLRCTWRISPAIVLHVLLSILCVDLIC